MTQEQAEEIVAGLLGSGRLTDMEDEALAIVLGYADPKSTTLPIPETSHEV